MITTYLQARDYLETFIPDKIFQHKTMQLERMKYFCNLLGNPQNQYPVIHVSGTSGKGSTATFASQILIELGLKVGLHTSPHLQLLTERMLINNQSIKNTELIKLLNQISSIVEQMKNTQYGQPTYFEILTAMTFLYFAKSKIDVAVIEVGLGGKLDATNIIPPSVAILTNISLDHTNLLGRTTKLIVQDKMQIIKKGSSGAVAGIMQPKLRKIIIAYCQSLHVPLKLIDRDFLISNIQPKLPGHFQKLNFTLAQEATKIFINKYFSNLNSKLNQAFSKAAQNAFIAGRLEIIQNNPLTILDGAHNSAKMKALVASLIKLYPNQKFIIVIAVKKGKQYKTMIKYLSPLTKQFIFTKFFTSTDGDFKLGNNPQTLAKVTYNIPAAVEFNSHKAVKLAQILARKYNLPILITGSLYLIGEVRSLWFPRKLD